ncbi:hypothetical protein N7501_007140 [Penicillium viridicatum]|nr:hypothetical protein N7501_007140 [Penicillium viridicatum]
MDPLGALGPALLKIGASNVWADVTNLQYEFKLNLAKVETLQEWTKTVDPATYLKVATQQGEWPDEMKRAYLNYKALAELIKPSKDNYKALSNKFGRTPTPAQCLQLAELAIQSGEVVLKYLLPKHHNITINVVVPRMTQIIRIH